MEMLSFVFRTLSLVFLLACITILLLVSSHDDETSTTKTLFRISSFLPSLGTQIPLEWHGTHVADEGVHLAVGPICGQFPGQVNDINAGLDLNQFEIFVVFGDSYTEAGHYDGSRQDPPIIYPPNAMAGGRSTNGFTWVENVANRVGSEVMDYARGGACTNLTLWPSNPRPLDFLQQMDLFLGQSNELNSETTLYTIFFGINDWIASHYDGDHMQEAAQTVINNIYLLASPPTNARQFMVLDVYGRGEHTASGEGYKQTIYNALGELRANTTADFRVAYVDYSRIWDGVLNGDPGYEAFGYTSPLSCTDDCTEDCDEYGWCKDPDTRFYWFTGHPSKVTHEIMADYVQQVVEQCKVA